MLPPFRQVADRQTDFEFLADDATLAAFERFIDARHLEIDSPEAVEWWSRHGPQFDQVDRPDARLESVSRIRVQPSDDAGNSIMD